MPCLSQQAGSNVAPAVGPDGTIVTVSRAHSASTSNYAFVVALRPDLSLKWATSMRGALTNLINSVGLDVRLFASPQEYMQSKPPDAPGCLVLDVRMPGMSGLAFQQELVKAGITLPIIFLTGHGDVAMTARAMKAGAAEFLTKPFSPKRLYARAAELVGIGGEETGTDAT